MRKPLKGLKIFIGGVPPGVRVGIFDERKEKGTPQRVLLLEEVAGPEHFVETEIDKELGDDPVKVVIRAAGFIPY